MMRSGAMIRKVFRYMRVSTDQQAEHGYSLEAQDQVLRDYAAGHQLEIAASFVESESAFTSGKRPEFARMCAALRVRSDVNAVLVYKLDRLARNMTDFALLTEDLGATLISMTEGEVSDRDSGTSLIGGIHAVVARHYSQQLSQRVALGLKTKARRGEWPTYAPTGYVNKRDGRDAWIEPDQSSAPIITKLFTMYAHTQMSVAEVAAWARAAGLRSRYGGKIYKSAVHKMLQDPIYRGAVVWHGEEYPGKHEAIVDPQTWRAVQDKLHGRTGPRRQHRHFPFRDTFTLTCAYCGGQITASRITNRHGGEYVYYHCTRSTRCKGGKCEQPFWREDVLSERLRCIVEGIHVPGPVVSRLLREFRENAEQAERTRKAKLIQLKAEQRRLEEMRNALLLEKIEQIIEPKQWADVDRDLAARGAVVADEIEGMSGGARCPNDVAATFKLLKLAPIRYNKWGHEERAELLQALASNCVLSRENVLPNYRPPFDAVASAVETGDWLGVMDVVQTHARGAEPAARLVGVA